MSLLQDEKGDGGLHATQSAADLFRQNQVKKDSILRRIAAGTEGSTVLVGSLASLTQPICAFVRLACGIIMPSALEVPLPVRFIFVLLTPKPSPNIDCHEVGRSFSTLMSNPRFHDVCYKVEERGDVLNAINEFLDESVVLPPGDYSTKRTLDLLDVDEINHLARRQKVARQKAAVLRKRASSATLKEDEKKIIEETAIPEEGEDGEEKEFGDGDGDDDEEEKRRKKKEDPFFRSRYPFGGIWRDVRRRYSHYLSDFRDGLNMQTLSATIFIYFACLSGAIAFGGLLGEKSRKLIGIPETVVVSSMAGIAFALFAGQPLIITGVTGPVLLYDEALFSFCDSNGVLFLPWRVWIGVWTLVIALVVAGFQGSLLVKYFTKFTKDIFAALVSLLFIYESLKKLYKVRMQVKSQSYGNDPIIPTIRRSSKLTLCNRCRRTATAR